MKQNRGSNGTQRFIEKLKILKEQGIDVTKITQKDTIETLAKKSGVVMSEEQAEKLGIELIDRIGNAKMNITNTYRGNGSYEMPTKEQVQILSELGVSLELLEKRNIVQEFIEKLEILKEQGIDVTKITRTDTIQTLAEKSGVVITDEQAKKLGIKLSDKVGKTRVNIARAYRGEGACKKPTQEQVQKLSELGVSLELLEKRNIVQEFIEKLEILKEKGIDVSNIQTKDTIETLAQKSGIELTEEKARELGIKLNDKIGVVKYGIVYAYRGKGNYKRPTQEQAQMLQNLGISLEIRDTTQEFIEKLKILKELKVDATKIALKDTIQTLAEKSGVIITEEQSEELGMKLNDKIGQTKKGIADAWRGNGTCKKPTQEQVQELQKLGISLEKRKRTGKESIKNMEVSDKADRELQEKEKSKMEQNRVSKSTQRFIEKLKILKELKVDVTKIVQKDTIQTLAEKSGIVITEEKAEELGIKLSDKIGYTKMSIARAYRGKGACKKPSQEQVQELLELGISLEARDVIQEFIEKLEILKEQGIDVTKIIQKDTIETLAEKSGVVLTEEKAEELGIELSDKIGITKTYIASAHRGKGYGKKPSQDQVQSLLELGISLGLLRKKDMIQEFIKKIEILKEQGIDVTKIAQKDTIETLAEKSGVIITEEKVKELGIELSDKIGQTKKNIISAYRGNEQHKKPTKEEVQKLQNLGINFEARDTTQEFIEKLEILKELKVDVTKIAQKDTIETLAEKSGVIITEEKAEELGIKLSDKIGQTRGNIASAHRGKGCCKKPTQEQVQELQNLGISLEKRKRTGKEIAGASISSIKNMEVSDKADRELQEVVKEVENKKSNQK